jgi:hypothetical protein
MTSSYLPSLLVASAVIVAGSLISVEKHLDGIDFHPPTLVAVCGYSADQTVGQKPYLFVFLIFTHNGFTSFSSIAFLRG